MKRKLTPAEQRQVDGGFSNDLIRENAKLREALNTIFVALACSNCTKDQDNAAILESIVTAHDALKGIS